ncbi:MAG: four helix bundle protein [Alistipes sp.]|nr:four helix bundle protein [Alistipes sp.]
MRDFRKYEVWKLAVEFSVKVYKLTEEFPVSESYGLSHQIRRATVSIASNIAEGASRSSEMDFCRFLEIALGSAFEVETQMIIANKMSYLSMSTFDELTSTLHAIQKMINQLIHTIK